MRLGHQIIWILVDILFYNKLLLVSEEKTKDNGADPTKFSSALGIQ